MKYNKSIIPPFTANKLIAVLGFVCRQIVFIISYVLSEMEISPNWGDVIFVTCSVNVNIVQICQIRRKRRFFFLWWAVNAGIMTRQNSLHIFFLLMNATISFKPHFISHKMILNPLYEIRPDNTVILVTHTGTIPARSLFYLVSVKILGCSDSRGMRQTFSCLSKLGGTNNLIRLLFGRVKYF